MQPFSGNQRKANSNYREKGPLLTSGISNDKNEWQGLVGGGGRLVSRSISAAQLVGGESGDQSWRMT